MKPVLIMGCGYVGASLLRYLPDSVQVTAVTRNPATCRTLETLGVKAVAGDLDEDVPVLPTRAAELFYFAPPPPQGSSECRLRRFLASIDPTRLPRRIVYISTSAVYGDCQGQWITEQQPLKPGTDRGRRRADAEQALLEWMAQTGVPVVILRVPGIYGPGKLPLSRLKKGLPLLREEESPYTNRIHVDDLVSACLAAMEKGQPGAAYHVSDGQPSNMTDYFNRIAEVFGLPRPPTVSRAEAATALSKGMRGFMDESKRLDITRMQQELGVVLRYASLEAGLLHCLRGSTAAED